MNVLLTAAGRRSYLVEYFRAALGGRGFVVAANSKADAPAMYAADRSEVLPPSYHAEYAEALLALCARLDIRLLCSCHDLDLLAVARVREQLTALGVLAALPHPEWARRCLDKHEAGQTLRAAGFSTPWSTLSLDHAIVALRNGEMRLPLAVKPRLGFASLSLHRCETEAEVVHLFALTKARIRGSVIDRFVDLPEDERVLIQEWVSGRELRTVLVNDFEGNYVTHYLSEVHALRAGETDHATTLAADALGSFPVDLAAATRFAGVLGVDLILSAGRPAILDLNPRFTGDYPFVHLAGADAPAILVALARGEAPRPSWLVAKPGVTGFKEIVPKRSPESAR